MARFYEVYTNWKACDRRKLISLTEKGKTFYGDNNKEKEVAQYHIDNKHNSVTSNNVRCDYAIYIFDRKNKNLDDDRLIFIELKGSDIKQGIRQIEQTIRDWIIYGLNPKRVDARIVVSKSPNPRYYSTDEIRLKKKLKELGTKKGDLVIHAKEMREVV